MRKRQVSLVQSVCLGLILSGVLLAPAIPMESQTQSQTQVPATAPQVREVLPSYEGQTVVSVEIAGRPDLDQQELRPLLVQLEGQPFSQAKIDQSISALKSSGKVKEVVLEIRPQANGIRVLLICQPAVYYGLFDFPGAVGRFPYSRLLQVSDYPPRGAYSPGGCPKRAGVAGQVFSAKRLFRGKGGPRDSNRCSARAGKCEFPGQSQSPCQIWQGDSQGCSPGRRTATSTRLEVMDGQDPRSPRFVSANPTPFEEYRTLLNIWNRS